MTPPLAAANTIYCFLYSPRISIPAKPRFVNRGAKKISFFLTESPGSIIKIAGFLSFPMLNLSDTVFILYQDIRKRCVLFWRFSNSIKPFE